MCLDLQGLQLKKAGVFWVGRISAQRMCDHNSWPGSRSQWEPSSDASQHGSRRWQLHPQSSAGDDRWNFMPTKNSPVGWNSAVRFECSWLASAFIAEVLKPECEDRDFWPIDARTEATTWWKDFRFQFLIGIVSTANLEKIRSRSDRRVDLLTLMRLASRSSRLRIVLPIQGLVFQKYVHLKDFLSYSAPKVSFIFRFKMCTWERRDSSSTATVASSMPRPWAWSSPRDSLELPWPQLWRHVPRLAGMSFHSVSFMWLSLLLLL